MGGAGTSSPDRSERRHAMPAMNRTSASFLPVTRPENGTLCARLWAGFRARAGLSPLVAGKFWRLPRHGDHRVQKGACRSCHSHVRAGKLLLRSAPCQVRIAERNADDPQGGGLCVERPCADLFPLARRRRRQPLARHEQNSRNFRPRPDGRGCRDAEPGRTANYSRCMRCGSLWMGPRPSIEDAHHLYPNH